MLNIALLSEKEKKRQNEKELESVCTEIWLGIQFSGGFFHIFLWFILAVIQEA